MRRQYEMETKMSFRLSTAAVLALAVLSPVSASMAQAPVPEFRSSDLPHLGVERQQAKTWRTDVVEIPLAAKGQKGARLEYKVHVAAGDALVYSLTATKPLVSEFHGESKANKAVMFYREDKATTSTHGQFVSPMTGAHGWYLANENDTPVTVRLHLAGYYEVEPGLIRF